MIFIYMCGCGYFYQTLINPIFRDEPFAQYVSVRASFHTIMTKQVLQYITGDVIDSVSLLFLDLLVASPLHM